MPEAVTFHDSYTFWAPDSLPGGPVIYIYRDLNGLDQLFYDITEAGSLNNKYFRENGLKVFICKSPKTDMVQFYKEEGQGREEEIRTVSGSP